MEHKEYNGWYNYETWVTALWMGNDQSSYHYWQETAQETLKNTKAEKPLTKRERATMALADQLKEEYEELAPELEGVYSDLLNAAMSEINWHEIAQHQIEDIS